MTNSFQLYSANMDVVGNLRKGGLQIFSCFTFNVFSFNIKDETHPYVNQCSNYFDCEQQRLGRN
jgi:hypothetical protein